MSGKEGDSARLHFFGIRHHGPGCARQLMQAFQALQPDCLLLEGPPEGEALLPLLADADLAAQFVPPVALLIYVPDAPRHAAFYPFADFSPEWQALQWAARHGVTTHFIDLPQSHAMALGMQEEHEDDEENAAQGEQGDEQTGEESEENQTAPDDTCTGEPLDWLARAAGHTDGEGWWSQMVEERADAGNPGELFAAVHEAMQALREDFPNESRGARHALREARREAHMRQCLRRALKSGAQRIAVVCGAWHVSALQAYGRIPASQDAALLKALPKVKVQATWAPWSQRNLCQASGYGAGVQAPGWYVHLWHTSPENRSSAWLTRLARLLRAQGLDCSSAHVLEATRLARSLAALRGLPHPGLDELMEAARSVIGMGEAAPLRLIEDQLLIDQRLGSVPDGVPQVPLQRDIARQQKSLRLKVEAQARDLALDLRKDLDLARSHFLHRLRLLDVPWGQRIDDAQQNRGTFRESWRLHWEPELGVRVIQASLHGVTVEQAATACVRQALEGQSPLPQLARALDDALLARLPALVQHLVQKIEDDAASTGDVLQLLHTLPPLGQVLRYGSVRQLHAATLARVLDGLIRRAALGLPLACIELDEDAAQTLHQALLPAHEAVLLRHAARQGQAPDAPSPQQDWMAALAHIAARDASAAQLRGAACRLLRDGQQLPDADLARHLTHNLATTAPPQEAALWLDGFLNRQAVVLVHDQAVWQAVDAWLASLAEPAFIHILPMLRRSFSAFTRIERQELGEKAAVPALEPPGAQTTTTAAPAATPQDEAGTALLLDTLGDWLDFS